MQKSGTYSATWVSLPETTRKTIPNEQKLPIKAKNLSCSTAKEMKQQCIKGHRPLYASGNITTISSLMMQLNGKNAAGMESKKFRIEMHN